MFLKMLRLSLCWLWMFYVFYKKIVLFFIILMFIYDEIIIVKYLIFLVKFFISSVDNLYLVNFVFIVIFYFYDKYVFYMFRL